MPAGKGLDFVPALLAVVPARDCRVQKVARTTEHGAAQARGLGAEVLREHFALARQRGLVTCAALVSQVGKDAAAVLLADEAGDQSLLFQPADDAG